MPINGVQAVGDDQRWKAEVEKELRDLRELVRAQRRQIDYLLKRVK
jgi:hypothetical protein